MTPVRLCFFWVHCNMFLSAGWLSLRCRAVPRDAMQTSDKIIDKSFAADVGTLPAIPTPRP